MARMLIILPTESIWAFTGSVGRTKRAFNGLRILYTIYNRVSSIGFVILRRGRVIL